jgi:multiple sugar transport system permease protein
MEQAAHPSREIAPNQPSVSFLQRLAFKLGLGVWRADQQFEGYLFLLPRPEFIGGANYLELFTRDPIFGGVLKNTFWYTVLIVPIQLALGFLVAAALNAGLRALRLYRMLYFMPVVASVVAAAMVFRFLFNQQSGVISAAVWQFKEMLLGQPWVQSSPQLLEQVQGIAPPDFLNASGQGIWPGWALVSVAVFTVWKNLGFTMVIYLAALQAVPDSLIDAAKVDGANARQRFRHVIIPLVSPTTFFLLVIQMLGAFQIFTEPFILSANTQGQLPVGSASIVTYIYQNAFDFQRMGKAAAISWVLFAIVFAVTILQTILQRRWVYYETD